MRLPEFPFSTYHHLLTPPPVALRLSYGVVQRSPRVSADLGFTYKEWDIPAGFPVSMDNFHMHHNEEVFPDSYTYKPERWLGNPKGPGGVKQLSRYMVAFGRGNRMCLGMQMAYAETILH
jgi:cytochrome P450